MELSADQFRHGSWLSMLGMGAGYVVLLTIILVVLFIVPYLAFLLT